MSLKSKSSKAWGSRLEVTSLARSLEELYVRKFPVAASGGSVLSLGKARAEYERARSRLAAFRVECESQWGQAVTAVELSRFRHGELFASNKVITLKRLARTPAEVTEGFLTASGSVDGYRIEPRELFWQRFRPAGKALGHVLVISPPFGRTGRDYYESAQRFNELGYDVLLMDHQWAGHSEGREGHLDSGFGVARDVAAVAEFAHRIVEREYFNLDGSGVTLLGKNLGASAGVLGALTLNDLGRLRLDGRPMPRGLNAVLVSPWLGAGKSWQNGVRKLASRIPLVNQLAVPGESPGVMLDSPRDLRSRFRAMERAMPDITRLANLITQGQRSEGRIYVIHSRTHPYIDPVRSAWLVSRYAERGTLRMVDHRFLESRDSKSLNRFVLEGIESFGQTLP